MSIQFQDILDHEALRRRSLDVPWTRLKRIAASLSGRPELWPKLRVLYDLSAHGRTNLIGHEWFYVPVIVAIAAPDLDAPTRRRLSRFAVDEMEQAAEIDDDFLLELFEFTCGHLGADALPAVLGALDRQHDCDGAWFHLWGLTALAAESDNQPLRRRVIDRCCQILLRAEEGSLQSLQVGDAARTIVRLDHREAWPMIQGLADRSESSELQEVMDLMNGHPGWLEPWEEPIEQWVESHWVALRHQSPVELSSG